jgi:uncharacterized protein (DUF1697 family)
MAKDSKYVALLRGINVGGNNKLPMRELAVLFEKAGCSGVRTYIQSGNVVFSAAAALARRLPELMQAAILKSHQIKIPVIVRSAAEMAKIAAEHPHQGPGAQPKFMHVGFLAKRPSAAQVAALDPQRSPQDVFVVKGSEIYIHYGAEGSAKSKLNNQYIDATLGTISTLRNWNTVLKLKAMTD